MKNIVKLTCLFVAGWWMAGCTANYEKYNTEPYVTYDPSIPALLKTMMERMMYVQQNNSQMVDQMVGTLGGYFTLSNRWGGQNFDTFNASDEWNAIPYNEMFEGIYSNYFRIEEATNASGHYWAMARLLRGAVMMRVADCYGPIPYSQVSKGEFYVEYDPLEEVYLAILDDLSYAATVLYTYSQDYPALFPLSGNDDIFDGNYAAWARLANSLSLRVAVRTDNRQAGESAAVHPAGLITANSHNATVDPKAQGNPYQLASASWGDLRVNSSIVDYMLGYGDPRCEEYFMNSTFNGYTGQMIGMRSGTAGFEKSDVAGYSMPNLQSGSHLPLFLAAETSFLLAEACLKGWNVPGTAQSNYEDGVRLSLEQYGITGSAITDYLADDTSTPNNHSGDPRGSLYNYTRSTDITVKWDDTDGDQKNLERIITQKWIANYPMGLEAWAEFRRTGYPELAPTIDNLSEGVITNTARGLRRLRYPYTERNLNRANYDKALALLGGTDNESVELFWAKKN
ncbi:MAG: SusD/RagB family nutrient-binding outer membrane lipoprotein [Rikenellaceae bacterium]|nr:SusD/RagB family nutrient-binding outer membrane lipoprotein [Rikenellaceae bacterium]